MDLLLRDRKVTTEDIQRLAKKIALFHQAAEIIHPEDLLDVQKKFNDLEGQKDFLKENLYADSDKLIDDAIRVSGTFMQKHKPLLAAPGSSRLLQRRTRRPAYQEYFFTSRSPAFRLH
jgi:hypothetical protein